MNHFLPWTAARDAALSRRPLFDHISLLPSLCGKLRDHVEQHVGARGDIGVAGQLQRVVADAAHAGDEDHCRRADAREHLGILPRAGGHAAAGKRTCGSGIFDEAHDTLIKEHRGKAAKPFGRDLDAVCLFQFREVVGKRLFLGAKLRCIGVTDVHGEYRLAGDHVDGVRLEGDAAGGGDGAAAGQLTAAAQEGHNLCRGKPRVRAVCRRRGAGVVLFPLAKWKQSLNFFV